MDKKNTKKISEKKIIPQESTTIIEANPTEQNKLIEICDKVGATQEHLINVLYEASKANKMTIDKYGDEHEEPDHDKRIKGAMSLLELRGDIKNKNINNDNSKHTHVTYSWQPVQVVNNNDSGGRINVD